MRISVIGPPHSGKSVVTASLIEILKERLGEERFVETVEWFALDLTDNTLGWLMGAGPRRIKAEWNEANVVERRNQFAAKAKPLVVADAPGKIDRHLKKLLEPADGVIIVSRNVSGVNRWGTVAKEAKLEVVAILETVPSNSTKEPTWDSSVGRGVLRGLDRNVFHSGGYLALPLETLDVLREVAKLLMSLAPST